MNFKYKYLVNMRDVFIFTDCDLDGTGSYLIFKWFLKKDIPYKVTRHADFKETFSAWYEKNGSKYEQVYVLDMDVSDYADVVDHENVTIIDHHKTHVKNKHVYTKAKCLVKTYSSCTKLVYNILRKSFKTTELTDSQKLIILYIDDYDCYELKHEPSYCLNVLFWNYQGDRLDKFISNFGTGFRPFTDQENKIIQYYKNKFKTIINDLHIHVAVDVSIQKTKCKLVSVFASECINEVADHIIKNYKADIGFVVNLQTKHVSIRKSSKCNVDLGVLAEKLMDGGGHQDAAGGSLTDNFLAFSKIFKPLKIKIGK